MPAFINKALDLVSCSILRESVSSGRLYAAFLSCVADEFFLVVFLCLCFLLLVRFFDLFCLVFLVFFQELLFFNCLCFLGFCCFFVFRGCEHFLDLFCELFSLHFL